MSNIKNISAFIKDQGVIWKYTGSLQNYNSLLNTTTTLQSLNWCPVLTSIWIIAVWNFSYLTRFKGKEDINNRYQRNTWEKFQGTADTLVTAYPLIRRMTPCFWIATSCTRNNRDSTKSVAAFKISHLLVYLYCTIYLYVSLF